MFAALSKAPASTLPVALLVLDLVLSFTYVMPQPNDGGDDNDDAMTTAAVTSNTNSSSSRSSSSDNNTKSRQTGSTTTTKTTTSGAIEIHHNQKPTTGTTTTTTLFQMTKVLFDSLCRHADLLLLMVAFAATSARANDDDDDNDGNDNDGGGAAAEKVQSFHLFVNKKSSFHILCHIISSPLPSLHTFTNNNRQHGRPCTKGSIFGQPTQVMA